MARDIRQVRRTIAGAILIVLLAGGALLVFFLETIIQSMTRRYEVVAVIGNAPGLANGSPVWISGRKVGTVTKVAFMPSGGDSVSRLAVTLELLRSAEQQVRTDSRVHLTSTSPIGRPVIDIVPGTTAATILRPGDTLRYELRMTAAQITARSAIVKAQLDTALQEVRRLSPAVRKRLNDTRRVFASLDAAMAESRRLNADLRSSPGAALLQDPAFTASLARARAHAAELPAALARMRQRTGEAGEVGAALARLQVRADTLDALLRQALSAAENPNGTFARIQQDSAIFHALDAARAELDSLIAEARRNPLRFVF